MQNVLKIGHCINFEETKIKAVEENKVRPPIRDGTTPNNINKKDDTKTLPKI